MSVRNLPQSYGDAARFLNAKNRGKGSSRATVANNTEVIALSGEGGEKHYGLVLHGHIIVKWYRNGKVVLDSCGWVTPTTKDRINYAQKLVYVCQRSYRWYYVEVKPGSHIEWDRAQPFEDGLTLWDQDQAVAWHYDRTGDPNGPTGGYTGD